MGELPAGVRVSLAAEGVASVATGIPVLDHLVSELARAGRLRVSLEVAPDSAEEEVAAAGRAFGRALKELLEAPTAAGRGWALAPAQEALAAAALEVAESPLFMSNADFAGQRVAGVATDVVSRFLGELCDEARLNLHVRVLEGVDPQHVVDAIFKAVGAALGLACRPPFDWEGTTR